jgi:Matrixin
VRLARRFFSAALGVALFGTALHAGAFCLTHGCNDRKQDCEFDELGCLQTGPLLHWASSCVSFDVQKDGSALRSIPYGDAHNAIVVAFTQWLNADCGGGRGPYLSISDYGPVDCRTAEYNQDAPNANIFMFRDDTWPYENAIDTLALTTLIFNADNGEIYDADVEVNTFQGPMSLDNIGPNDVDFNSVITHEIGHFLGLSHSQAQGATMRASYAPGQTAMASIEQDDVDGVCAALPPSRDITSEDCGPRHGFSGTCALKNTCAMTPGSPGALGSLLLTLLGLSSSRLRRRFRPSARRP